MPCEDVEIYVLTILGPMAEYTSTQQTSTGSTTSSPGATPISPDPTPTNTTAPSPGLSTGASAAIGVGVAVVVCIGLVLLWLGWRRVKRRRALAAHGEEGANHDEPQTKKGPMNPAVEAKYHGPFEAPVSHGPFEAPVEEPHRELPGQHTVHRHELGEPGR